jgi:hypothetical protein
MTLKKILIIISIPVLLYLAIKLWSTYSYKSLTKDIFGINFQIENNLFSHQSNRDFHGDGFSIIIDKLNQKSTDYFKNIPVGFFEKYPKRHYHLGDYRIYKWRKTPVREEDLFRIDFAVNPEEGYKAIHPYNFKEIDKQLNYTELLLMKEGNYYAMFFAEHPNGLFGIDLFVISPEEGIVVKINRQ